MARENFLKRWRETCRLCKAEAADLLGMTAQRYHYMEVYSQTWPKEAARVCATVWAERTERSVEEFYQEYHDSFYKGLPTS